MLERVIMDWLEVSGKCLVYQHEADSEIKKTHCHILIEECSIGQEGLLKRARKIITLKGNDDHAWSQKEYGGDVERYIVYMTKGKHDPVYNKGYCPLYLEECKKKWVEPSKAPGKADLSRARAEGTDPKDNALISQYKDYVKHCLEDGRHLNEHMELKDFRGMSITFWRKRNHGLMPTASTYKRFLVSVYLEYCDRYRKPMSEQVIDEVDERM